MMYSALDRVVWVIVSLDSKSKVVPVPLNSINNMETTKPHQLPPNETQCRANFANRPEPYIEQKIPYTLEMQKKKILSTHFFFQKSPSVSDAKNPTITINIIAWLNSPKRAWCTCTELILSLPLLAPQS